MSKHTLYLLLIIVISPVLVFSQNEEKEARLKYHWSIHAKYAIPYSYKSEPTYNSFETSIRMQPSTHVIVGVGYRYFFKEKLSLDVELSYEDVSFIRFEEYSYTSLIGVPWSGTIENTFQNYSILNPIKLTRHFNRISLSVGIVNNFHLVSQVNIRQQFFEDGQLNLETNRNFAHGDRIVSGSGSFIDRTNVDLEGRINIQALLGVNVRLSNRINLNFELRQYLKQNRLVKELFQYDVANSAKDYYYPFASTFSMGVSFDFNHKKSP